MVDLIEEGQDVAVRIGQLPDSSLTAVRVGAVRRLLVAAPSYLKRHGPPRDPGDLAAHRLIASVELAPRARWAFTRDGQTQEITVEPGLLLNTVDGALDAARSGWGVTRALSYQVAQDLARGDLIEVCPDTDDLQVPVHLVHAEGVLRAAKIRAFMDFAARRLRESARLWGAD